MSVAVDARIRGEWRSFALETIGTTEIVVNELQPKNAWRKHNATRAAAERREDVMVFSVLFWWDVMNDVFIIPV